MFRLSLRRTTWTCGWWGPSSASSSRASAAPTARPASTIPQRDGSTPREPQSGRATTPPSRSAVSGREVKVRERPSGLGGRRRLCRSRGGRRRLREGQLRPRRGGRDQVVLFILVSFEIMSWCYKIFKFLTHVLLVYEYICVANMILKLRIPGEPEKSRHLLNRRLSLYAMKWAPHTNRGGSQHL